MNPSQLERRLSSLIPEAKLETYTLDTKPKISLSLINADYPRGRLPADVALRLMENPLYWAFCWASGDVMAQYILQNKSMFKGKRIVDFGCGSGVVAIAAALAGAQDVIACDIDELAITATKHNAELNNVSLRYNQDFNEIEDNIDIIFAADVLYDRDNYPWLETFSRRANTVLIADSRVKNFEFPGYKKVFSQEACTLPDLDESKEFRMVNVYRGGTQ